MRKRNHVVVVLLLFVGFVLSPLSLLSQSRATFTRTALSRMDVLSRAAFFEEVIAEAARKEGVDPLILWTIAFNETRFRPWLTSPKNAKGMMQFIPATASRFGLADPYEPNSSIHAAARYVKYLGGLFGWRLESVLAAYNAGEGTVLSYLHGRKLHAQGKLINPSGRRIPGGIPPYSETARYVSQGVKMYRWLQAQRRFGKTLPANPVSRTLSSKPEETEVPPATEVFYDVRTGGRFLVSSEGQGNMQPIDQTGPVIISPDLRGISAQRARSTFAGISKP